MTLMVCNDVRPELFEVGHEAFRNVGQFVIPQAGPVSGGRYSIIWFGALAGVGTTCTTHPPTPLSARHSQRGTAAGRRTPPPTLRASRTQTLTPLQSIKSSKVIAPRRQIIGQNRLPSRQPSRWLPDRRQVNLGGC